MTYRIGIISDTHGLLWQAEEEKMPVILLWGIPTLLVVGGGGYWLMHLHH